MKDPELKATVCRYAALHGVAECAALFKGVVTAQTIYNWTKGFKLLSYAYTPIECMREWERIKSYEGRYDATTSLNKITLTNQPHFYHIEQELYKDLKIRKKLIENRKKYLFKDKFNDRELLRGFKISGIHIGYSHFSPMWIKKFITDYNIKSIYDPCGGWGHRLLGAASLGIEYIYNDLWKESVNGATKIAKFINYNCAIYNNDCTLFTPFESYECIFTCPPYHNTEIYQSGYSDIDAYDSFLANMLKSAIKDSVKYIGIVINGVYKENIVKNMPPSFTLVSEETLGSTAAVSHFNKTNTTKEEVLCVFSRR